uniref:Uncharacterized protein n=1 Tax=Romanomermis culicivorax TaxID=13658 RepID=A0A915JH14_ROMCU
MIHNTYHHTKTGIRQRIFGS